MSIAHILHQWILLRRSACMLELEYSIVHIVSEMNGVIGASNFRTVESTLCTVNIAEFFCSADTPSPYALDFTTTSYRVLLTNSTVNSRIATAGMEKDVLLKQNLKNVLLKQK